MLFHLSALSVVLAVVFAMARDDVKHRAKLSLTAAVVWYFRQRVYSLAEPYLPTWVIARLSNYTPLSTYSFADQAEAGMSSNNFDLDDNMGEGSSDARMGLDAAGVEEVRRIMAVERCTFDQARLIRHNRILAKNGIAPDGTPLDRKAITRL